MTTILTFIITKTIVVLTTQYFSVMNRKINQYQILPQDFLDKIGVKNQCMNINEKIIEWNQKMYPEPTFVSQQDLKDKYGNVINWRKIQSWQEQNLVRTKPVKAVYRIWEEYDPTNENHIGKKTKDILYYALEDFAILVEKDQLVKNSKVEIVKGTFSTLKGKKGILRDFRRENPDQSEIDNLSDSYATFIAWLALEKIKEEANLSAEYKDKLEEILNSIIPQN